VAATSANLAGETILLGQPDMKRLIVALGIVGLAAMLGGCDKCGDSQFGWGQGKTCSKPSVQ
jgi:hypothetical protein